MYSSAQEIPDLGKCILILDDFGVHQPHPVLCTNIPQMPVKHVEPTVFRPHPLARPFVNSTSLGSVGSLLHSSSSSVGSRQSVAGGTSTTRWDF